MTTVIHLRDSSLGAWEQENETDLYIGRQNRWMKKSKSIWANPFKPGKDGTREEVMDQYEAYIKVKMAENPGKYDLNKLKGKNLVCYCTPELCHGDVLIKLMNNMSN